jgi:PBSX family phage terminase large subunit
VAKKPEYTKEELSAIYELWRMGELSWKLKGKQIDIYNHFVNLADDVGVCLVSRRFGKSYVMLLIAIEICIKNPGCIIKYACPKQNMVNKILMPNIRSIFEDAPSDITYEYSSADKVIRFHNGAEIQFAGTDNGNAENLRGGAAILCILDEAGFMDDLQYIVESILLPTTDTTDGKLFLASTPNPKDPDHQFHTEYVYPVEAKGKLVKYTIYDSPMLTPDKIRRIIGRYVGGESNPAFRVEYLVEIPKSSELTVIPEFNEELHVVDEYKIPSYRDFYVAMDVGFRDLTCVLFCYYNFLEATLYVIDEIVINGPEMTTDYLATLIKNKEDKCFNEFPPFLRVMDNDLKLANDLSRLHELYFMPTAKDNKETAVNNVRMWFAQGKIKIHKRCTHLVYHTKRAQWDTSGGKVRTVFKHLADAPDESVRGGHADSLDALIYLVRNLNTGHNPYPDGHGEKRGFNIFQSPKQEQSTSVWAALIPKSLRKGR